MEQIKASGAEIFVTLCHACHGQINDIKKTYDIRVVCPDSAPVFIWKGVFYKY
jgi:heterodisulfide reductase subunit B